MLLNHPEIENYCTVWMDTLRGGATQLVNTNKLLKSYNGITGLKTGTTGKAGVCISASASRDDLRLIAVVLGSSSGKERLPLPPTCWIMASLCLKVRWFPSRRRPQNTARAEG